MTKPPELLERLRKFAIRLRVPVEDQWDLAFDAYVRALECGVPEWHFASVCLKNLWMSRRRNERRRKTGQFTYYGDEAEPVEYRQLGSAPAQIHAVGLSETWAAIEELGHPYSSVMRLVAEGWEPEQISRKLDIPVKEVYWRTGQARKKLRERGHHEIPGGKKGHSRFIGVKRDHHRFVATIREAGVYYHLGQYGTAEEAARAYDAKAKALRGPNAKLNFPQ